MFKKINHIGIVVKSLEEAISIYSKGLGIAPEKVAEIKDVQLKVAVLKMGEIEISTISAMRWSTLTRPWPTSWLMGFRLWRAFREKGSTVKSLFSFLPTLRWRGWRF